MIPSYQDRCRTPIKPGDYLLGYLTGVSRWIAVLEVISDPYMETSQIWQGTTFPCRVKVKVITSVPPESGIPVLSLSKQLRIFDNMKSPNWGLLFRIAPREMHQEDGELITKAIQTAEQQTSPAT